MVEPHSRTRACAGPKPPPDGELPAIARRHARSAGLTGVDAEDCAAACWGHLWQRSGEAPAAVTSAWMEAVAANFARDFRRRLRRQGRYAAPWPQADSDDDDRHGQELADLSPPTDASLMREWFWTEMEAAIGCRPASVS
jgi:DNA-directed RNA polymerase specialized sigma24 family protein